MNAVSRVSSLSLALPVSTASLFLPPSRSSRSFSFSLPRSSFSFSVPVSRLFSLVLPSRFCPVPRSTLAILLFRDLVSAAAFLFFPPSDLYARLPPSSPPLPSSLPTPANLAPVSPFTRALFRLLLRSVPAACVSTAKSIDRNVFRNGRNERECNRRDGVAYEIRAI